MLRVGLMIKELHPVHDTRRDQPEGRLADHHRGSRRARGSV